VTYIRVPLITDPESLAQSVFQYITGLAPNWTPQDGNLDVWIIRAVAALAAENRDIASDVQDDIFRYYGGLVGVPPLDATAATGTTTWVMRDSAGYTIPAGTNVGIRDVIGDIQTFQTTADYVIPPGQTATPAGAITIAALQPGAAGNNLGTAGQQIPLIDVIDYVNTVTLINPTTGGKDAETDDDYLARLVGRMQRLSQRPILPVDFSTMALDADPSIARAVAIDGYNPADSTYNNMRMVTVIAIDANGAAVSAGVKTKIDTLLQANREVNFIVNEADPRFTTINVVVTYHLATGFDQTTTDSAVTTAIQQYLNPALWGQDPTISQGSSSNSWIETPNVYFNEMIAVVSNVSGVDHVVSMTLNGGTADIAMATPGALPTMGTLTINHA